MIKKARIASAFIFSMFFGFCHFCFAASISSEPPNNVVSPQSGAWYAASNQIGYADISKFNGNSIAFVLQKKSKQFWLYLESRAPLPTTHSVVVQIVFNKTHEINLSGRSFGREVGAQIPDNKIKKWTHYFTSSRGMTISFPGTSVQPLRFSLDGSSKAVSNMAQAITAAGITNLPAPWQSSSKISVPSAQAPNIATISPAKPSVSESQRDSTRSISSNSEFHLPPDSACFTLANDFYHLWTDTKNVNNTIYKSKVSDINEKYFGINIFQAKLPYEKRALTWLNECGVVYNTYDHNDRNLSMRKQNIIEDTYNDLAEYIDQLQDAIEHRKAVLYHEKAQNVVNSYMEKISNIPACDSKMSKTLFKTDIDNNKRNKMYGISLLAADNFVDVTRKDAWNYIVGEHISVSRPTRYCKADAILSNGEQEMSFTLFYFGVGQNKKLFMSVSYKEN